MQTKLIFGIDEFLHTWYGILVAMAIVSPKSSNYVS